MKKKYTSEITLGYNFLMEAPAERSPEGRALAGSSGLELLEVNIDRTLGRLGVGA